MKMPFEDDSCDVLTVAFGLRNMADYSAALTEMRRVIRPGGHLLVLDFSIPKGLLEKPYTLYLNKVLPKIAGFLTGEEHAYSYLAGSIADFPSGSDMLNLIEQQGFTDSLWMPLSGGIASVYIGIA